MDTAGGYLTKNSMWQLGHLALPWDLVTDALGTWGTKMPQVIRILWAENDALLEPHKAFHQVLSSNTFWLRQARRQEDPLLHGVIKWRSRKATLLHDNIIALLGLWPPETLPLSAACRYDMPVDEMFCAFRADIIIHTYSLQPLMCDPRLEHDSATPNIPRWTIDMQRETRMKSIEWRHVFLLRLV